MKANFETFKTDVDLWIKDLHGEVRGLSNLPQAVKEHTENIDHNYELINEVKSEVIKLKEELSALRMIQLLHLKSDITKKM